MASKVLPGTNVFVHAAVVWAFFLGLYLLFVFQISAAELAVGAVTAGVAAAYQAILRANSDTPPISLAALRPLVPATGALLRDTFVVGGVLISAIVRRPPDGRVRVIPPPVGDPGSAAGRAIAITAASLAPNSFVLSSSFEAGLLVVHRLADAVEKPA